MPEDAPLRFRRPPGLEFSTFASWADLSRTIAPLYATAGTIKDGGTLAAEIDRIAARTSDPRARADAALRDRKSVVQGKSVYVRVDLGGCRIVTLTNHRLDRISILQ